MTLSEKIFGNSIGAFALYGWTAAKAALKPLLVADNGDGTGTLVVGIGSIAAGTNLIGKVGIDQTTANANEVVPKHKAQLHANIDFSSASAQTIIAAPGVGNRIRICQLLLMSGAATPINSEIAIKSGSTTIKTIKGASNALDSQNIAI